VTTVAVIDYGAGNTRSVRAALERLRIDARLTTDPAEISSCDHALLPGVGSARQAMSHLTATGAADALRARHRDGQPILGICLGLQLALEASDEDGGVETLGIVPGKVRRIEASRVPRIGWAVVEPWDETYYFAHSYSCDAPGVVATSEGLVAVIVAGSFTGVQFHPEKSGAAGFRWLAQCLSAA
jgi:glutamine amidotransferase